MDKIQKKGYPLLSLLSHVNGKIVNNHCLAIRSSALFSVQIRENVGFPRLSDWYETNDRVELHKGALAFLGRNDTWVKINGELVDLVAIEQRLASYFPFPRAEEMICVQCEKDPRSGAKLIVQVEQSISFLMEKALEDYHRLAPSYEKITERVICQKISRTDLGKKKRNFKKVANKKVIL